MSYAEGTLTIIFGLLTIIGRKQLRPGDIRPSRISHRDARCQYHIADEAMSLFLILLLFWAQMIQRSDPGPYARCFVSEKRVYCQDMDGNLTAQRKGAVR